MSSLPVRTKYNNDVKYFAIYENSQRGSISRRGGRKRERKKEKEEKREKK